MGAKEPAGQEVQLEPIIKIIIVIYVQLVSICYTSYYV
jgi:hypothetical protein